MPLWATPRADRHHANPNKEDHDPDIGEGVLAFTTAQAVNRAGRLPRAIARNQAVVFLPLLTLEGLNMHAASPRWLFHARCRRLRRTELLLLLAHVLAYPARCCGYCADPGGGLRRRASGGIRALHGLLVRTEPQGHADHRCGAETRLPTPPSRHIAQMCAATGSSTSCSAD